MISGLPAAFVRRWRLAALGLIFTIAIAAAAAIAVPVQYSTKAAILLVPPNDSSAAGSNPYLNLSALQGLNNVLAQALTDSSTSDALQAEGLDGTYTITSDAASSGPIVIINAQAKTAKGATAVVNELAALLPIKLKSLQQSAGVIAEKSFVTNTVLNPASKPIAVSKNQTRALIAAVAVGLVVTFLLVASGERLAERRRAKRPVEGQAATTDEPPSPPVRMNGNGVPPTTPTRNGRPLPTPGKTPAGAPAAGRGSSPSNDSGASKRVRVRRPTNR